MTQERIDKLNSIGFIWSPWVKQFEKLAEFTMVHGTAYHLLRKNDKGLWEWITKQRDAYHNIDPILTPYRITKLNSIGFCLDTECTVLYIC